MTTRAARRRSRRCGSGAAERLRGRGVERDVGDHQFHRRHRRQLIAIAGLAEASDVLAFANGEAATRSWRERGQDDAAGAYTLAGDANLDGAVDFLDLSRFGRRATT